MRMDIQRRGHHLPVVSAMVAMGFTAAALGEGCPAGWSAEFGNLAANGVVLALAAYDPDGPGGAPEWLVVGGSFNAVPGLEEANGIAAWDGERWHRLSTGVIWSEDDGQYESGTVSALQVIDEDGEGGAPPVLVAAGQFQTAGGVAARNVGVWNGEEWSAMGAGVGGRYERIRELVMFDEDGDGPASPRLFAGGYFSKREGSAGDGLVRWDGSAWSEVGVGFGGDVRALVVHDEDGGGPARPALYVAGGIPFLADQHCGNIARWDGAAWSQVGTGLNKTVTAMVVMDDDGGDGPAAPSLIAYGAFRYSYGGAVQLFQQAAKWDGEVWSAPDVSVTHEQWPGRIITRAAYDPDADGPRPAEMIYGGQFGGVNGQEGSGSLRLKDGTWAPVGGGLPRQRDSILAMATFDPDAEGPMRARLYAGGEMGYPYDVGPPQSGPMFDWLTSWDGVAWSRGADAHGVWMRRYLEVWRCAEHDPDGAGGAPTSLVVHGNFFTAGSQVTNYFASWDGERWGPVVIASDTEESVWSGVHAIGSVDFDGPGGDEGIVVAAGVHGYQDRRPEIAGARLGATSWSVLATLGQYEHVSQILAWERFGAGGGSVLVVAGEFENLGGVEGASRLAQWDGASWSALQAPDSPYPNGWLVLWDDDGDALTAPLLVRSVLGRLLSLEAGVWTDIGPMASAGQELFGSIAGPQPGEASELVSVGVRETEGRRLQSLTIGSPASWSQIGEFDFGLPYSQAWLSGVVGIDPDGGGALGRHVFVVGSFLEVNGIPARRAALWDGLSWRAVGEGLDKNPRGAVCIDHDGDGVLPAGAYVIGDFDHADGRVSQRLAKWGGHVLRFVDQPIDLTLVAGREARFDAVVHQDAGPAEYRWLHDGEELLDDGRISGAATSSLRIRSAGEGDVGVYSLRVTGGCGSIVSRGAPLVIVPPSGCPGDADGDGVVGGSDLSVLLASYGGVVEPGVGVDFNSDGRVGGSDLSVLLANFGNVCAG